MYPVSLDISGKLCVVIGGGSVAERKVRGLVAAGASVRVVSPEITDNLAELVREGRIDWQKKKYSAEVLNKAFLVFAATDQREVQEIICRQAEVNGQLVNVVDDPGCCNFHVPATMRRGDLTLAVSTNGKSPAVSAMVRKKLEREFGREYEVLLNVMSLVRQRAGGEAGSLAERKKIYKKILHNDIIDWIKAGDRDKLHDHLQKVLGGDIELDLSELELGIS